MSHSTNPLAQGRILPLFLRLAIPAIAAQLVNMLYNIVDRMFIGHIEGYGTAALTGVGLTFPIIMAISAFAALIGMGGAPLAAIRMGEGDREKASEIQGSCLCALLCLSGVLTVFFLLTGRSLLTLLGTSPETLDYAWSYLRIYICGTVAVQITLGMNSFITTQGYAATSMLTVVIGAVINLVLDPIFIFVLDMGVEGAALATVISQAVSAVWVLCFLSGRRVGLPLRRAHLRLRPAVLKRVVLLGVSPFTMQITVSILNTVVNTSLQKYGGDLAVGAMTIISSMSQLLILPTNGLSQGAQPIISYHFGARQFDRVRQAFRILLISSLGYSTLFWAFSMLLPGVFVSFFTPDPILREASIRAIRIYFCASFLLGIQGACQNTFVALGMAKVSMFLALLRKIFLLIPLILILPHFFGEPVLGVYISEPIADVTATACTALLFYSRFRKATVGGLPPVPEEGGARV